MTIVVLEVAVVDIVMASAIDQLPISEGNTVMDGSSPNGDGNEKNEVSKLVHGDDVGTEPVRPALGPCVQRMEGKGREGARIDEGVVELVERAIEEITMQCKVNPIDAEIGDDEEKGNRKYPISNGQGHIVEVIKV